MIEEGKNNQSAFHLAGVIPISGLKDSFNMPWHCSMNPVANNYMAVERAVVECAHAGCETIWVICDDDIQPIIKSRLGDYIADPCSVKRSAFSRYPNEKREHIPIFYTPIHPKDRDRRDSLIWSAMHGALSAFFVSSKISKWLIPSKYYICFPYGVYEPSVVYDYRKIISSDRNIFLRHDNKTAIDGHYLSFTISADDYKQCVYKMKAQCSGGDRSIPLHERWSSKDCSIQEMLTPLQQKTLDFIDVEWYYSIDSWEKYHDYLANAESMELSHPGESILKAAFYNKIQELGD